MRWQLLIALVLVACEQVAPPPTPDPAPTLVAIAATYAVDEDAAGARAALEAAGLADRGGVLAAAAQRAAADGRLEDARQLAALAAVITPVPDTLAGGGTPDGGSPSAPPNTPVPSATAAPTIRPSPSPTPPVYELVNRERVCDDRLQGSFIQVFTQAPSGDQVAGVEVVIEWDGGSDRAFTGFKPDVGPGYADFQMAPGVTYTVRLPASPGAGVTNIAAEACTTDAGAFAGSVLLVFRQR
jgi:hypothetical protein